MDPVWVWCNINQHMIKKLLFNNCNRVGLSCIKLIQIWYLKQLRLMVQGMFCKITWKDNFFFFYRLYGNQMIQSTYCNWSSSVVVRRPLCLTKYNTYSISGHLLLINLLCILCTMLCILCVLKMKLNIIKD